jgi:hypothetical protein
MLFSEQLETVVQRQIRPEYNKLDVEKNVSFCAYRLCRILLLMCYITIQISDIYTKKRLHILIHLLCLFKRNQVSSRYTFC